MTTSDLIGIALMTLVIEAVTCFLRFYLRLESTRDTRFIARFTLGLRIHHGYVGLLIFALSWFVLGDSALRTWALWFGAAMFLSDVVHHFVVLWPIVGSPEFDIFYPKTKVER